MKMYIYINARSVSDKFYGSCMYSYTDLTFCIMIFETLLMTK